ncbi:BON domain-containing protein [Peteryoungia ipomoeae]|nr:BON domain-containing protein [Peteryoungia ipomoeae]
MVNRNDNWDGDYGRNRNARRGPTGDYGPGDSGFVRGYDDHRPDADRYDRERQREFGMEGGYGTTGSRYPRMGRSDWTTDDLGYEGDLSDRGYGDHDRRYARGTGRRFDPADRASSSTDYGRRNRDYDNDRGFMDRASDEVASWFGDDEAARRREMDSHRGKGPRGYRRSDARILEDVNDRLADDPAVDASDIEVTVKDAEVTLSGQVTDRWEKRRAEDSAERVSGVAHVQNNLRIRISGEGSVMTQA